MQHLSHWTMREVLALLQVTPNLLEAPPELELTLFCSGGPPPIRLLRAGSSGSDPTTVSASRTAELCAAVADTLTHYSEPS